MLRKAKENDNDKNIKESINITEKTFKPKKKINWADMIDSDNDQMKITIIMVKLIKKKKEMKTY